jgi:adenylate cyclase class 2
LTEEIEVKARVEVGEEFARRIERIGGKFVREVTQEDLYFRHPFRDLKERDEALRLRREGKNYTLTFKGRRVGKGAKMREELEIRVGDYEKMIKLLERLEFEKAFIIRKRRKEFVLDGVTIALDSVEGLGEFVEIEVMAVVEEGGRARLRRMEAFKTELFDMADRLGIPRDRLTTESYLELLTSKSSSSKPLR